LEEPGTPPEEVVPLVWVFTGWETAPPPVRAPVLPPEDFVPLVWVVTGLETEPPPAPEPGPELGVDRRPLV
jgi:hypothetical protein